MTLTAFPPGTKDALESFYGRFVLGPDGLPSSQWEGTFLTQIKTPFPLRLAWDNYSVLNQITCHKEVAGSLHRVLGEILNRLESIPASGYDLFAGCYAYRAACGSHKLSFHAYGAAIQLGPLRAPKRIATEADGIVDRIFEDEGWAWLGIAEGWGAVTL